MKLRRPLLLIALFAVPALAFAHPGHDGDHDFGWDFGHLAAHPVATLACATVLVAAAWGVARLLKSSSSKTQGVTRDRR
jgi:hydrogenase/urease accessory protein HupE